MVCLSQGNLRLAPWICAALVWCTASAQAGDGGTVILHGGGSIHSELRDRFVELAGGRQAKLLVIPTADPENPLDESRLDYWKRRNPESVALLHADSRPVAEQESFAEPLKHATGVWISGGYQGRLAAMYCGTPVERELAALFQRGGVIAGTSAGAAILSRVMLVRNECQQGFDMVPHCVIDQHFLTRKREPRLWNALANNPDRFGLGIDEDTAAIIHANKLTVFGDSTVTLCIAAHGNQPQRVDRLKAGDEIDLKPLIAELQKRD